MRNPERIDCILDQIRTAWQTNPDLRLTQVLRVWYPELQSETLLAEDHVRFDLGDVLPHVDHLGQPSEHAHWPLKSGQDQADTQNTPNG